jgi:hypothetical protein
MKINVAATSRTPPDGVVPPGWGSDELSKFWGKRPIYDRLVAIDGAFRTALAHHCSLRASIEKFPRITI